MVWTAQNKRKLKDEIINCLKQEPEIRQLVIFGSFLSSDQPHDLDLAVFQDSADDYLTLAMKYRRLTRPISEQIPLDVLPVCAQPDATLFLNEIRTGEVIYER